MQARESSKLFEKDSIFLDSHCVSPYYSTNPARIVPKKLESGSGDYPQAPCFHEFKRLVMFFDNLHCSRASVDEPGAACDEQLKAPTETYQPQFAPVLI
jgi:hypothetical protein